MISAINSYNLNQKNNYSKPAFTSIHVAKYYVKWDDGYLYEVKDRELVKKLQRSIVSVLNKNYNKSNKTVKLNDEPLNLRETATQNTIFRLFKEKDPDFIIGEKEGLEVGVARSFYSNTKRGNSFAYIITGDNRFIVENAGKGIGRVWQKTNDQAEEMSASYGISYESARRHVAKISEGDLKEAKTGYYDSVMAQIREILSKKSPKDSEFSAYFVPKHKGKKIVYELVDANFTKPE